ncbi:MAG: hypothetical protein K0U66_09280 [Gammaproteobacteria bacterium]|nr:hypothetical protein [Gammaproteobacteria bacterium]
MRAREAALRTEGVAEFLASFASVVVRAVWNEARCAEALIDLAAAISEVGLTGEAIAADMASCTGALRALAMEVSGFAIGFAVIADITGPCAKSSRSQAAVSVLANLATAAAAPRAAASLWGAVAFFASMRAVVVSIENAAISSIAVRMAAGVLGSALIAAKLA